MNILAAAKNGGTASQELNNAFVPLSRATIDEYISALRQVDSLTPNRTTLLRIYKRVMLDHDVTKGINKRIDRIKLSKYNIYRTGTNDADETLTSMLETKWFMDALKIAMLSEFQGVKVIEVQELEDRKIKKLGEVPMIHVDPWKQIIMKSPGDLDGWKYAEPPLSAYYIQCGDAGEYGLLHILAPLVIYKSLAFQMWSDYGHKLGVPPRVLTRKNADVKRLKELEAIMKNMLSSNWAIIGAEEELKLFEAQNMAGSKDIFDGMIARCRSGITGLILGEDGTTEKSGTGTFGSLKVMSEVSEEKHQADKQRLYFWINDELIPRLVMYGYPMGNHYFGWDEFQELSPKEVIDAVSKLSINYEFDVDALARRTGLPITGLRRLPGESFAGEGGAGLGKLNARMRAIYPKLKEGIKAVANPVPLGDMNRVIREVFAGRLQSGIIDTAISQALGNSLVKAGLSAFNFAGVEWNSPDNVMASKLRDNLHAFSSAKTEAQIREMGRLIVDEGNQVRTFTEFRKLAAEVAEIHNVTYLTTEYNQAIASSQMARQWADLETNKDILPYLIYKTAGDSRVRDDHRAFEGVKRHIDDDFWRSNYPPNGWGCRCDVRSTGDPSGATAVAKLAIRAEAVPEMFRHNVGQTGIVFGVSHPYYQEMRQAPTSLNWRDNYAMAPSAERYEGKLPAAGIGADGEGVYSDVDGLKVYVPGDLFGESTRAVNASATLRTADEVWTTSRATRYLKYYREGMAVIDVGVSMQASGWQWIDAADVDVMDTLRNGILIKG